MNFLQDRRGLGALIVGLVVLIALGGAFGLMHRGGSGPASTDSSNTVAVPSSGSGPGPGARPGDLQVVMGKSPKVEADTSVRCFVNGQFVGMETAAACAQKNGVAPGALDVGLDQSGAIAAGGGDTRLQPISNATAADDAGDDADDDHRADAADPQASKVADADAGAGAATPAPEPRAYADMPPADCKAYAPGGWRNAARGVGLDACVHTLFDGRCPTAGQVVYGHWGALTLRAAPGRIDVSRDNRSFTALAPQYPADCSIPPI